jgi:hypothetical protein
MNLSPEGEESDVKDDTELGDSTNLAHNTQ